MIFMQHFPSEIEIEQLKSAVEKIDNVINIHDIKGWSLDDEKHYLRFHVCVLPNTSIEELDRIKIKIREVLGNYHVFYSTIEFESTNSDFECNY